MVKRGYWNSKLGTGRFFAYIDNVFDIERDKRTWSLPGCWCDVLESVKSNTIKEESGRKNKQRIDWDVL